MKRQFAFLSLAALVLVCLWPSGVRGQTSAQDGQSTRGVQQGQLGGAILDSDSTMRVHRANNAGATLTAETLPLNEKYTSFLDAYYDTLSINGRSLDSTSVVYSCGNYGVIVLGAKMEGHHGAAGNAVRIGVTAVFSFANSASDTSTAFAYGYTPAGFSSDSTGSVALTAQIVNVRNEQELVFLTHSAVSINYMAIRSGTLVWKNPGYPYVRFIFRVISDLATAPTQGAKFKLRCSVGMRAI